MNDSIEKRLAKLDITIPQVSAPIAAYLPFVRSGNMLFISGQLPVEGGKILYSGRVPHDIGIEDAKAAARLCGLNILAQTKAAVGSLDKVVRCVKLGGFVACDSTFTEHPKVINGASELMQEVFGDTGKHVRFAVGAPSLPLNAVVEVEALFEVI